jgi:DUF4097 and DUF4098 domain-containing protein YvlB
MGILALLVSVPAVAQDWEFSGIDTIELEGVSGDITILSSRGGGVQVELESNIRRGRMEPSVEQRGGTLQIKEDWGHGNSSGEVHWTLYIPGGEHLDLATASGDLTAESVKARVEFSTASGDVRLRNVELERGSDLSTASGDYDIEDMRIAQGIGFSTASGDIELSHVEIDEDVSFSTASGDVACNDCRGHLSLSTASGDVLVKNSSLEGLSEFSSASGDVELYLDELPHEGLSASSASGDVVLDSGDFGRNFTLVMTAREDKGRIVSPFRATSERTFRKGHNTYEEQVVEQGSGGPEIELSTASGSVVVKD